MLRRFTAGAAVLIAVAACTTTTIDQESTTAPDERSTTVVSTTDRAATSTSTTTTASTSTAHQEDGDTREFGIPDPEPRSDGAAGSGCTPGSDTLPDGTWFGYITAIHQETIEFDLACWYTGDIAHEKAAEAGGEAPGRYWIANNNDLIRTIKIADNATIWRIHGDISSGLHEAIPASEWDGETSPYTQCPGDNCLFWISTQDGAATELVEQYTP